MYCGIMLIGGVSMFLKKSISNGRVYLSIVEGYRIDGKVKQRTIKKLGFLDDLEKQFKDPISHFSSLAKELTLQAKHDSSYSIEINTTDSIKDGYNLSNVGYGVFKSIYNEIDFYSLFKIKTKSYHVDYSFNKIFQLLVFSRILYPASKKETFTNKDIFFEPFNNFSLHDIYRSLDYFNSLKKEIQEWIWKSTKDTYKRDASTAYYDCTNYYFEIAVNDIDLIDEEGNIIEKGYRKRGPEKNKRPDPIVQMGLLMDSNGIPLSYDLFPGNESEKTSLRPLMKRTKSEYGINRTIIVADRGLNTSDNMYFLAGKNDDASKHTDGYVYGQSVRGADKKFKDWVLDTKDYIAEIIEEGGNEVAFIHKSRTFGKEVTIKKDDERKVKVTICQKQMVYYSSKYARKQKRERNQMIEKAKDLIKRPGSYTMATSYGAAGYIQNIQFHKKTGEVELDKELLLDLDKIIEEEKYDGYYSIVTSEMELSDGEIRNIYKGLIKIEDTFKVTKSNLEARPAYVWTSQHIEAHFLTCFVGLVLLRLLENKLDHKYSVNRIIESIKKYNCINLDKNIYQFLYHDEVIEEIEKVFDIDLSKKYRKKEEIRKLLQY